MATVPTFYLTLEQNEQLKTRWPEFDRKKVKYNATYDAFYYEPVMEWIEPICEGTDCPYCRDRPFKPI